MNKGNYNGLCNLSSCKSGEPATWYNHGSMKYYCKECAEMLSNDPFNMRDAKRMFNHTLCTEGEHFSQQPFESEPFILRNYRVEADFYPHIETSNPWPTPHHSKKKKH